MGRSLPQALGACLLLLSLAMSQALPAAAASEAGAPPPGLAPVDSGVVMDDLKAYSLNMLKLQALAFQQHLSDRVAHYYDPLHAPHAADSLPADAAAALSQGVVASLLLQSMGQQMGEQGGALQGSPQLAGMLSMLAGGGGAGLNPLAAFGSGGSMAGFASAFGRRLQQAEGAAPVWQPDTPALDYDDEEGSITYTDDYDESYFYGGDGEWGWLAEAEAAEQLGQGSSAGVEVLALGSPQDLVSLLAGVLQMSPADAAVLIGAEASPGTAAAAGWGAAEPLPHFAVFGPGVVDEAELPALARSPESSAASSSSQQATTAAAQHSRLVELVVAPFTAAARSPVPHQRQESGPFKGMDARWWGAIVGVAFLGLICVAVAASKWSPSSPLRAEDSYAGHLVPYHNMPGAPQGAAWESALQQKEAAGGGRAPNGHAPKSKAPGHAAVPRKTSNLPA